MNARVLVLLALVGVARVAEAQQPVAITAVDPTTHATVREVGDATDNAIRLKMTNPFPAALGANGGLKIECLSGCGGAAAFADTAAFTIGTTSISNIGGVYKDAAAALADGVAAAFRLTSRRALHINLRDASGNELASAAAAPDGTERGLVVRNIPSGTQTISIPNVTASGTITANGQTVSITPQAGASVIVVQLTGTYTGVVDLEGTVNGTDWFSILNSGVGIKTGTSSTFSTGVVGYATVRIRSTSWTSGTLNLAMTTSTAPAPVLGPVDVNVTNTLLNIGSIGTPPNIDTILNSVSVLVADGDDLTLGSAADAAAGDAIGTVNAHLRGIVKAQTDRTQQARISDGAGNARSANVTAANALVVDGSAATQPVSAAALPLPSGAATSAKQDTGNTSLASIDGKIPALGQAAMSSSLPVVIASNQSALSVSLLSSPTVNQGNAGGSAWLIDTTAFTDRSQKTQLTDGTRDGTIKAASTAPGASDTALVVALSPNGAQSTSAKQDTGNTSLSSIDTKLTDGTQKAITRAGAKGATAAADVTSTAQGADHQAHDVQVYHGSAAIDPRSIRALTSSDVVTLAASSAVVGHVIADSGSTTAVTGNVTAIQGTGTNLHTVVDSGSITANAGTNLNTSALALSATQTDRTQKAQITDGTRDGTVKAASTAALATDTSVVVALSPNSPIPAGTAVIGHVIHDSGSTTVVTGNVTAVQGTGTNLHTVVDSGTVTANAGSNLNTSALSLSATQTDRSQKTQITDGTRDGTVKAASIAPAAADTALVVALSPNGGQALEAGGNLATIATNTATMAAVAVATMTRVGAAMDETTLLAANSARKGAAITNTSRRVLLIKFGSGISSISYTFMLKPGMSLELPAPIYTGLVTGVWAEFSGGAIITEM